MIKKFHIAWIELTRTELMVCMVWPWPGLIFVEQNARKK